MPKEVAITRGVLLEIIAILIGEKWELMRHREMDEDVLKYRIEHQRGQPRGIGFKRKDDKGHTVKLRLPCDYDLAVWYKKKMPLYMDVPVSFPPGVGMGWALVVDDHDRAIYYATPCIKTLNFKENFLWNKHITWKRVENWPVCPKCAANPNLEKPVYMEIVETEHHGNFWACYKTKNHADGKYARLDWNFALTPEERKIKEAGYRARAKVRRARKLAAEDQGKPTPRKAHDIRIAARHGGTNSYPPAA